MIWKCEIKNGTAGWTEVELVGKAFETEFRKRFGSLEFRNVRQLDYERNKWVPVEISSAKRRR